MECSKSVFIRVDSWFKPPAHRNRLSHDFGKRMHILRGRHANRQSNQGQRFRRPRLDRLEDAQIRSGPTDSFSCRSNRVTKFLHGRNSSKCRHPRNMNVALVRFRNVRLKQCSSTTNSRWRGLRRNPNLFCRITGFAAVSGASRRSGSPT